MHRVVKGHGHRTYFGGSGDTSGGVNQKKGRVVVVAREK